MLYKKNVLDKTSANYIYQQLLENHFPWFFLSNSALAGSKDDSTYSWFHLLYDKGVPNSDWYPRFELGVKKIIETFGLKGALLRARLGLHTYIDKKIIGTPHVDSDDEHYTILYYLNSSDGDTFFYKNKKPFKTITPLFNSAVMFDGSLYHSSSKPLKTIRRMVLNINVGKRNICS
tara:strand:- start:1412 stop:1939 length:528 start_codon:yes stop_codon:yes gene_type:complete